MGKKQLKRGKWTKEDIKLLRSIYRNHTTKDVAKQLGRPRGAVQRFASRLGLRKTKKHLSSIRRR